MYLCEMEGENNAGFNKAQALVKALSNKGVNLNDVGSLNNYLECYYYMVYFLNESGKKATGTTQTQRTAEAASRIIALEDQAEWKAPGTEETKKRFAALLEGEKLLKQKYDELKKK
jgi:hypothetical protein